MDSIQELWLRLKLMTNLTTAMVVANSAIFVLTILLTPIFANSHNVTLFFFGAESIEHILAGQLWRLVLPAFLHANFLHLAFNMWALYNLGMAVERFYGTKKLFIVYVLSAVMGSIMSIFMSAVGAYYSQQTDLVGLSVGASGAVFGLIGLLIGNRFKDNTYSVGVDNYINTSHLWFFVIYNLLIGFGFNTLGASTSINNWAHIGGFLGGFILGTRLDIINTLHQTQAKKLFERSLFKFSLGILVLSVVAHVVWLFV